ncbi:MAG: hypothetical protein JXQ30_05710 [Spirochaetes bacterium]|nr:hypothetical protein [Spirochaetota bacterium]
MDMKCPGAKLARQPEPELFRCPSCGYEVEIWTDEFYRTCPGCGFTVTKNGVFNCIEWCDRAKECIGETLYAQYMARRIGSLKKRLLEALEDHLRRHGKEPIDGESVTKTVSRTVRAVRFAEKIIALEGGEPHIAIPAVVLFDIGRAARRDGAGAGAVRKILLGEGLRMEHIDMICGIVASPDTRSPDTRSPDTMSTDTMSADTRSANRQSRADSLNLRIVHDARLLVRLEESRKSTQRERFLTESGRTLAASPAGG